MLIIPGKIPIRIHPLFWVVAALIGWANTQNLLATFIWMMIIIVSVLIHEFGHALTALLFKQKATIELIGFGGVTQRKGPKLKFWQDFLIVLNGPLAGFLLSLLAYTIYNVINATHPSGILLYIFHITFYINLFWTIINLLPIQPLDGGHLLRIILEFFFGLKGIKIALFLSMILAIGISIFFFIIQAFLTGAIVSILAFESYREWKNSLPMQETDQNFIIQHMLKKAEQEIKNGNRESALNILERLREMTKSGVIYLMATQLLANLFAQKGEYTKAYDLLYPIASKLEPASLELLQKLAYGKGEWKLAAQIGKKAYQAIPHYQTALTNAMCYSLLNEVQPAIGWLHCAIRNGLPNIQDIMQRKEFDNIRKEFQ